MARIRNETFLVRDESHDLVTLTRLRFTLKDDEIDVLRSFLNLSEVSSQSPSVLLTGLEQLDPLRTPTADSSSTKGSSKDAKVSGQWS